MGGTALSQVGRGSGSNVGIQNNWRAFNIFKCKYQSCCNFFTSLSDKPRKYCSNHKVYRGIMRSSLN